MAVLLISLPVAVMVAVTAVFWSAASPEGTAHRLLGSDRSVQAGVDFEGSTLIHQSASGNLVSVVDGTAENDSRTLPLETLQSWVPAGDTLSAADVLTQVELTPPTSDLTDERGDRQVAADLLQAGAPVAVEQWAGTDVDVPGSGEGLVSEDVLADLGCAVGDQINFSAVLDSRPDVGSGAIVNGTFRIVGTLDSSEEVIVGAGTFTYDRSRIWDTATSRWYVLGEIPVSWDDVKAINTSGFSVTSRSVVEDPPDVAQRYSDQTDPESSLLAGGSTQEIFVVVVVILAVFAETIMLVIPVLTVAQRRDMRTLALVAANGGDDRDRRRIMLSYGVMIGVMAGVLALALGSLLGGVLALGVLGTGVFLLPLGLVPLCFGLSVIIGAFSALFPAATAARLDVAATLAERPSMASRLARRRAIFPVLALLGAVAEVGGVRFASVPVVVVGSVALLIGLIGSMPWVLHLAGRLSDHGPLAWRLALRDAIRQGHRTLPAFASIMTVIFAVSGGLVWMTSHDEAAWQGEDHVGARGTVFVSSQARQGPPGALNAVRERAVTRVEARFGEGSRTEVRGSAVGFGGTTVAVSADIPFDRTCPSEKASADGDAWTEDDLPGMRDLPDLTGDPWCTRWLTPNRFFDTSTMNGIDPLYFVDDGTYLDGSGLVSEDEKDRLVGVLREGGAIVPDERAVIDGRARVRVRDMTGSAGAAEGTGPKSVGVLDVPAVSWDGLGVVILSPQAAEQLGVPVRILGVLVSTDRSVSPVDALELSAQIRREVPGSMTSAVEQSGVAVLAPFAWVLAGILVAVGSIAIVVGLAAADTRPDLDTLESVGASPGMRRQFSVCQALVLSVHALPFGMAAGVASGAAIVLTTGSFATEPGAMTPVIPWIPLLTLLIGLPIVSVLVGAVLTPSRERLMRRID